jgi:hypothetical protein
MNRRTLLHIVLAPAMMAVGPLLNAAKAPEHIEVGGATLDVYVESDQFDIGEPALLDWITRSAQAVTAYFGRFPVAHARVRITASDHGHVSGGMSFGNGGAHCRISVGRHATQEDLLDDWELTHEMVHFSFPSVEDRHHWIEEGIATYVEPIARASVGIMTAEKVWGEMRRDMPQGLPATGDRGLDRTHTWGRTYWGGALFCLMADVEIRKQTANTRGLQDALRAINRAGGTIEVDWLLERAIEIGDKATGGKTLAELYSKMAFQPVAIDLDHLWEQLGVLRTGRGITLDDHAPLAAIRRAICGHAPKAG